jgi:hypothetical protein
MKGRNFLMKVAVIGKKFTSPPFKKAENEQKTGKTEDVTLIFTIPYKV